MCLLKQKIIGVLIDFSPVIHMVKVCKIPKNSLNVHPVMLIEYLFNVMWSLITLAQTCYLYIVQGTF